jgi:predicted amino acid-binding ACT domain protein
VVFAAPITGAKQTRTARELGFHKSNSLHGIRVMAADKPGLGLALTQSLANAGINVRGFSGTAVGKRAVFYIALDTLADVSKATRCLNR